MSDIDEIVERSPVCRWCVMLEIDLLNEVNRCAAFPDGVPDVIWADGGAHAAPLPGQTNDVVFTPDPDADLAQLIIDGLVPPELARRIGARSPRFRDGGGGGDGDGDGP